MSWLAATATGMATAKETAKQRQQRAAGCTEFRPALSAFVDGELDADASAHLLHHLNDCAGCGVALGEFRRMGQQLRELPPAAPPPNLGLRLRVAASHYSVRGQNWAYFKMRVAMATHALALPVVVGTTSALVLASVLMGGVRANIVNHPNIPDVPLSGNATQYATPPRLAMAPSYDLGAPVLVEANIDAQGRVYGYRLLSGPADEQSISRLNNELLLSVFEPATTAFGKPTTGSLLVSFGTIEVKG